MRERETEGGRDRTGERGKKGGFEEGEIVQPVRKQKILESAKQKTRTAQHTCVCIDRNRETERRGDSVRERQIDTQKTKR